MQENEFNLKLQQDMADVPTELRTKLTEISVPHYKLKTAYIRNNESEVQVEFFIFAKAGDTVLFFDPLEDEFGYSHLSLVNKKLSGGAAIGSLKNLLLHIFSRSKESE